MLTTENRGKQPKNTRNPDTNLVQLFDMRLPEAPFGQLLGLGLLSRRNRLPEVPFGLLLSLGPPSRRRGLPEAPFGPLVGLGPPSRLNRLPETLLDHF